jgi:PIN domain nuclease of toxin-antitoxin system
MKYLLDTHTFLWLVNTPEVLPDPVRRVLEDRSAIILVSIVVPWEIAIKAKIGKLEAGEILDDFEAKLTKAKLDMLETTVRQVVWAGRLPLHHRDPFDRLLIAQAFDLRIPILSNDQTLDFYGVSRIWN